MRPDRIFALALVAAVAACEATMPPPPRAVPEPPPSGKAQLDDGDIRRSIAPIQDGIDGCIDQYRAAGTPEAVFTVEPTGRVSSAKVFRVINFSERACLERALRMARFPMFSGAAMTLTRDLPATVTPDGGAAK